MYEKMDNYMREVFHWQLLDIDTLEIKYLLFKVPIKACDKVA